MSADRKLEEIAANLDDISDTLEDMQGAAEDGKPSGKLAPLEDVQRHVEKASEAIDEAVDPD